MKRRWAVVIPSDSFEHLRLSALSVLLAHPDLSPHEIHVVSRSLNEKDAPPLLRELTYVQDPKEEFSFARRVNLGLEAIAPLDAVVMGDDVEVVTRNAFDLLSETACMRVLSAAIRGRVGPPWQREGEAAVEVPFVSFVCVYISRVVVNMVGFLEDRFPGYGYDDTDYCVRAKRAGLSIGVDPRVVVEHNIRIKSVFMEKYGGGLGALEREAEEAFRAKWMLSG